MLHAAQLFSSQCCAVAMATGQWQGRAVHPSAMQSAMGKLPSEHPSATSIMQPCQVQCSGHCGMRRQSATIHLIIKPLQAPLQQATAGGTRAQCVTHSTLTGWYPAAESLSTLRGHGLLFIAIVAVDIILHY
jgi:hypothetical protein